MANMTGRGARPVAVTRYPGAVVGMAHEITPGRRAVPPPWIHGIP
ncbi:hypothetical protein [Burkholderia plantarii]|nr:hypothetical protein [Burkholderia plantarii]